MNGGDDGFPVDAAAQKTLRVHAHAPVGVALSRVRVVKSLPDVCAGAEGAACAVEDRHPRLFVHVELMQRRGQVLLQGLVDGVEDAGPVEGHVGDAAFPPVCDGFGSHG